MDTDDWLERGCNTLGLDQAQHLLIWSLRRLVLWRGEPCPRVQRGFAEAFDNAADDALATFRAFIGVLADTARERTGVGRPG